MSDMADRLLQILRGTVLSEVRLDQPDLNMRQLAIALVVYRTDALQTVRGLAEYLNISKPAVTRALDRLGEFDIIRRKIDPNDRRSVQAMRTQMGAAMMKRLEAAMSTLSDEMPS
jgi:DNA-binding MarR family transcriptional regulator